MTINKKKMCATLKKKGELIVKDKAIIIYKEGAYQVTDLETGVLFETEDITLAVDQAIRVYFNCKSPKELEAELHGREEQNALHFDKLQRLEQIAKQQVIEEPQESGFAQLMKQQSGTFEIKTDAIPPDVLEQLLGNSFQEINDSTNEAFEEMLEAFQEEFDVDVSAYVPREADKIDILNDVCLGCVDLKVNLPQFIESQKGTLDIMISNLQKDNVKDAKIFIGCRAAVLLASYLEFREEVTYTTYRTRRGDTCDSLVCFKIERRN